MEGEDLDRIFESGLTHRLHPGDRGLGVADDEVDVWIRLKLILDQRELNVAAGVPPFGGDDLNIGTLGRVQESLVGGVRPSRALRSGEEGHLNRLITGDQDRK